MRLNVFPQCAFTCSQCMIADMEFSEADSPEDRALKLRMLEIYNM
jgi:hypothetical protein